MAVRLFAVVMAAVVGVGVLAATPHASAVPVGATYSYGCDFEGGGIPPFTATVEIVADVPAEVGPAETLTVANYTMSMTAPAINFSFPYVGFTLELLAAGPVAPLVAQFSLPGETANFADGFTFFPQSADFVATGASGDSISFRPGQITWAPFPDLNVVCDPDSVEPFATTLITRPTPSTKADCMRGGSHEFVDDQGRPFRNQGLCIKFVNHLPTP